MLLTWAIQASIQRQHGFFIHQTCSIWCIFPTHGELSLTHLMAWAHMHLECVVLGGPCFVSWPGTPRPSSAFLSKNQVGWGLEPLRPLHGTTTTNSLIPKLLIQRKIKLFPMYQEFWIALSLSLMRLVWGSTNLLCDILLQCLWLTFSCLLPPKSFKQYTSRVRTMSRDLCQRKRQQLPFSLRKNV